MASFVDVSALKPKRLPQRFQGGIQGLRRLLTSKAAGTDEERERLTPAEMKMSPKEVLQQSEKEARSFVIWFALASLVLFLVTGVVAYGYGPIEKWGPVRALYFSIAILTTVGLGNLAPSSQGAKLFTTAFNLVGILIDGVAVGELWAFIQEKHNKQVEEWNRSFAEALSNKVESTKLLQPLAQQAEGTSWFKFTSTLFKALVPLLMVNLIGAGLIGLLEGWTVVDMIYYATVTCTTTGYGALHPTKETSYVIAIMYFPMAALAVGKAVSTMAQYALASADEDRHSWLLNRAYTWEGLFEMDTDGDGSIGEGEFIIYFLDLWKMADVKVVEAIKRRFRELDTDGSGRLTKEDFIKEEEERKELDTDLIKEEEEGEEGELPNPFAYVDIPTIQEGPRGDDADGGDGDDDAAQ